MAPRSSPRCRRDELERAVNGPAERAGRALRSRAARHHRRRRRRASRWAPAAPVRPHRALRTPARIHDRRWRLHRDGRRRRRARPPGRGAATTSSTTEAGRPRGRCCCGSSRSVTTRRRPSPASGCSARSSPTLGRRGRRGPRPVGPHSPAHLRLRRSQPGPHRRGRPRGAALRVDAPAGRGSTTAHDDLHQQRRLAHRVDEWLGRRAGRSRPPPRPAARARRRLGVHAPTSSLTADERDYLDAGIARAQAERHDRAERAREGGDACSGRRRRRGRAARRCGGRPRRLVGLASFAVVQRREADRLADDLGAAGRRPPPGADVGRRRRRRPGARHAARAPVARDERPAPASPHSSRAEEALHWALQAGPVPVSARRCAGRGEGRPPRPHRDLPPSARRRSWRLAREHVARRPHRRGVHAIRDRPLPIRRERARVPRRRRVRGASPASNRPRQRRRRGRRGRWRARPSRSATSTTRTPSTMAVHERFEQATGIHVEHRIVAYDSSGAGSPSGVAAGLGRASRTRHRGPRHHAPSELAGASVAPDLSGYVDTETPDASGATTCRHRDGGRRAHRSAVRRRPQGARLVPAGRVRGCGLQRADDVGRADRAQRADRRRRAGPLVHGSRFRGRRSVAGDGLGRGPGAAARRRRALRPLGRPRRRVRRPGDRASGLDVRAGRLRRRLPPRQPPVDRPGEHLRGARSDARRTAGLLAEPHAELLPRARRARTRSPAWTTTSSSCRLSSGVARRRCSATQGLLGAVSRPPRGARVPAPDDGPGRDPDVGCLRPRPLHACPCRLRQPAVRLAGPARGGQRRPREDVRGHARASVADDIFRLDASDVMPEEIGLPAPPQDRGAFLQGMADYVVEGPESLDAVLRRIDAAWPR